MSAVFSHGRLRLYLLKLLAEGPKHGYELIRLLENRFLGLYAPSAGTIYPRLARMELDGLVTHTAVGGRKVYEITEAGRGELTARAGELADLESEIHASVADLSALATQVEEGVRGSVRDLKQELRNAAAEARGSRADEWKSRVHFEFGGGDRGRSARSTAREAREAPEMSELENRATELLHEVRRLVRAGKASSEQIKVAVTVLESVRDQLRRLLS